MLPDDTAIEFALNRKVQGGGVSDILGFPSRGHAHHIGLNPPDYKESAQGLINWQIPQGTNCIITRES